MLNWQVLAVSAINRLPSLSSCAVQGFRCWVKQPVAGNSGTSPAASTPIVFIHGVGLGVVRLSSASLCLMPYPQGRHKVPCSAAT